LSDGEASLMGLVALIADVIILGAFWIFVKMFW
jgi:hypothetical protein